MLYSNQQMADHRVIPTQVKNKALVTQRRRQIVDASVNLFIEKGVISSRVATGKETDGHDWENILRTLGWLKHDHLLAKLAYTTGLVLMILALAWGGYLLYRQFKNLDW